MKIKTIKIFIISLLILGFINAVVFMVVFNKSQADQFKENHEEIFIDDNPNDNLKIALTSWDINKKKTYAEITQAEELRLIRLQLQSLNSNLIEILNK